MTTSKAAELCKMLGIDAPIVQTGMGWVATPPLVAAASNAGAFGFLAAATIPVGDMDAELDKVKALTDRPFGVNYLMDAPGAEEKTDAIIRHGAAAAGYNRGPRPDLVEKLKANGVLCIPTCGAPRHAQKAQEMGADIVIMQGAEGGGHTGPTPTNLLLSQTVKMVDIPVLAAGGFHDGRGLVAALAMGASGIAMGTRFLLTAESPVPTISADRYLEAKVTDVLVTDRIDGMPQRVVRNELVDKLESGTGAKSLVEALRSALSFRKVSETSIPELLKSGLAMRKSQGLSLSQTLMAANAPMLAKRGVEDGDPVGGYLPGGSVAGVIGDRPTCAEVVDRIMAEAEEALAELRATTLERTP